MFTFCGECEYWLQNDFTPEFGQCRRKAPTPQRVYSDAFIGAYNNRAVWTYTRVNDGCGEGEKGSGLKVSETTKDQTMKFNTKGQVSAFEAAIEKARKGIK